MVSIQNKEYKIKLKIIKWYSKNKRVLPWRVLSEVNLPNPYHTLISEFMLQQTTVKTVIPKFVKFIAFWPNIKSLSKINESKILEIWAGLGYYSRAKNLLKTVKIISKNFKNIVPDRYDSLIQLPGIGDYSAKAILGIAFNQPVMPVDANIERIITRIYGFSEPVSKIKKKIYFCSNKLISKKKSSILIQSFMDYGSKICIPKKPKCSECIISEYCNAFKNNITHIIPIKKKKNNIKILKYTKAYIVVNQYNEFLVRRRPSKGMLPSMLEMPTSNWNKNKRLIKQDKVKKLIKNKFKKINCNFFYSFSHFDLNVEIFYVKTNKIKIKDYFWYKKNKILNSEFPTIMKKIMRVYEESI